MLHSVNAGLALLVHELQKFKVLDGEGRQLDVFVCCCEDWSGTCIPPLLLIWDTTGHAERIMPHVPSYARVRLDKGGSATEIA